MKYLKYNIVGILLLIALLFMSVGFALYAQDLGLYGNVTITKQGKLEIISASLVESESSNIVSSTTPSIDGLNLSFNVVGSSQNYSATYLVEVSNNTSIDNVLTGSSFNASINDENQVSVVTTIYDASTGEVVSSGDLLPTGSTKIYKIKYDFTTTDTNTQLNVSGKVNYTTNNNGKIIASITPKSGNLQGDNTIACFTVSVANTYTYSREFSLSSSDENILIVDSLGELLGNLSIGSNETKDFQMCTKVADGSIFVTDEISTIITLKSTGIANINVGELTLAVDKDIIASDKEIPEIGNVNLSIADDCTTIGEATLTWDRIDTGGSSITNYYIILYDANNNTSTTYETGSSLTSYTFSNLSEGNYYAKVYGVDEALNIGSSYCDSATTDNGYCSLSNTASLKWQFTITYNLSNLYHDGESTTTDTATINTSYSTTLTAASDYNLPYSSGVTITMNGTTLSSSSDYSYSSSSGVIKINKITGDVTIKASARSSGACLAKGTSIALANGKHKNIEDISYSDLLLVWNYETGSYTYEYPIWIEKESHSKNYTKITFDDGTYLNIVGNHALYNADINEFITLEDVKIGTVIAKIANNKIEYVKVKSIDVVNADISYYHVVSTRYYNIVANGILTTDDAVVLSNLYGFNNDISWKNRNYNELELYDYSLFEDFMPYYMFKGLRAEEAKVVYNYLDYVTFKNYLINNQLNEDLILKPDVNSSGNRMWMVTTSDDDLNSNNYLYEEGNYYILKEPLNNTNFKYWYNTSDGKIYNSYDKVKVIHGMHFVAIYE